MTLDLSGLADISALISAQNKGNGLRSVRVDAIHPDPNQPRKRFDEVSLAELAQSIESIGMIQPPVVRTGKDCYLLISGERRWRAARWLGWDRLDVIVRDDLNSRAQLVENIQREDLSAWEIYRVIAGELDAGAKQLDLAKAFGKSKQWISAYASIAKMPEAFMVLLRDNRVSGLTALQSLYRLYEDRPDVARQLLASGELITAVGIAAAAATFTPCSRQAAETHHPSDSHEDESRRSITTTSSAELDVGSDTDQAQPLNDPTRTPHVLAPLPIRIRVEYDSASWIVDYTNQRREVDGTVSVKLNGADGNVLFAPLAVLRLNSIEIAE